MWKLHSLCFIAAFFIFQFASAHAAIKERAVSVPTKASGNLSGTLYTPAASGPAPAILILHTAGGLSEADRLYARGLAEAGFVALTAPYQIGWVASVNQGLAEAVDWLRQQPESLAMPVGVVGFSLGASKALLVAALRPAAVKAVVAYYGTYNVEISKFKDAVRRGRQKNGLATPSPVQVASKIDGAILLLQGERDDETAPDQTRQMTAALDRAKKTYELKIYPGAVHMFERETKYHPPRWPHPFWHRDRL